MAKLIGTAGHVDHGKTTLIRALTGIDADRLPEEKRRGMTIDLGFAYVDLPRVGRVSIVDVPGHEKFLANMLVGALGTDVALFCVAADESVMPQTREHLQILDLLPVEGLVVALTRSDLVDEELIDLARAEVEDLLAGTRFAGAPIIPVSAQTAMGMDELRGSLAEALEGTAKGRDTGPWYMPIDRAFVVKGYGTVVTGTLARGTVREGDPAVVMPDELETRVRALQRHDQAISEGEPGMRLAINLGGVSLEEVHRGQAVGAPGSLFTTTVLDASIRWIAPVKHATRIRLSIGAREVIGKVFLSDVDPSVSQFRLEYAVAAAVGQPLIVRRYSPPELLGGGRVLVPQARVRRKSDAVLVACGADDTEAILDLVSRAPSGLPTDEICRTLGRTPQALGDVFEGLKSEGVLLGFAGHWLTPERYRACGERLRAALRALHQANPNQAWVPRERAVDAAGLGWRRKPLDRLLASYTQDGLVRASGSGLADADFRIALSSRQEELLSRVEDALDAAGVNVPGERDLAEQLSVPPQAIQEIVKLGLEAGRLVRIGDGIIYSNKGMENLKREIAAIGAGGRMFSAAEVRDRLQTTRKYVIPLLEYLDSIRFTLRRGESRVLQ